MPLCYTDDPDSTFGWWTDNVAHLYDYESSGAPSGGARNYANRVGVNIARTSGEVRALWEKQLIDYELWGFHADEWDHAWTVAGNDTLGVSGERIDEDMEALRALLPDVYHNPTQLRILPEFAESSACATTKGLVDKINEGSSFGLMMSSMSDPFDWGGDWLIRNCEATETGWSGQRMLPIVLALSCGTSGIDLDYHLNENSSIEYILPLEDGGFVAQIGPTRGFWQSYYYWYGEKWLMDCDPDQFPTIGDLHNHVRMQLINDHLDDANMPIFCDMTILLGNPILRLPGYRWDPHVGVDEAPAIVRFRVEAPSPNPFVESVTLRFSLPESRPTSVQVFDVRGRLVRLLAPRSERPGRYCAEWDSHDGHGRPCASGVYFMRIEAASGTVTRRVVLMR